MEEAIVQEDKMHGSMFVLFKRYVEHAFDYSTWAKLQEKANLAASSYQLQERYPTRELRALVQGMAQMTNTSPSKIWEQYGEFLVPDLLLVYRQYVQPEWRTYDLLLNTEAAMHGAVRKLDSRTDPPILLVTKKGNQQLVVDYYSPRKMAGVAIGIIKGIARYYQEEDKVTVTCVTGLEEARVQLLVNFSS